jgi:hypothetical protein
MKKIILFAALVVGVIANAAAKEPIKFGVRAGLNFDSQKLSYEDESETSDNKIGFHLGAVADIPYGPSWLYFQPGVYISTKGGKSSESGYGSSAKSTTSLYYVEVLLRDVVKFSLTNDVNLQVNLGPSIGVALSGKEKIEATGGGLTGAVEGDVFDNDDMSRFHIGLNFGAGVEIKHFYLGLGYDLGLLSMYSGDEDISLTNRTLSVSLGYKF